MFVQLEYQCCKVMMAFLIFSGQFSKKTVITLQALILKPNLLKQTYISQESIMQLTQTLFPDSAIFIEKNRVEKFCGQKDFIDALRQRPTKVMVEGVLGRSGRSRRQRRRSRGGQVLVREVVERRVELWWSSESNQSWSCESNQSWSGESNSVGSSADASEDEHDEGAGLPRRRGSLRGWLALYDLY